MSESRPTPRHEGYLDGKAIIVYGRNERSTVDQVRQHLRKQPTYALLGALGRAAWKIERGTRDVSLLHGVPVTMHAIASLALLAIEASNDHRTAARRLDDNYLAKLFDLFFHLPDPISGSEAAGMASEFMLRAGEHQFIYQGELRHQLPRMWLILKELWPDVEQAKEQVPTPLADFESLTGLSLEDAFVIGLAFMGAGKAGVVEPFLAYSRGDADPRLKAAFTNENRAAFLRWTTGDYAAVREAAAASKPPSEAHLRYRFNPLRLFPLVRPAVRVEGLSPDAVLLPIWRLLYERATLGVFHDLADHYNRGEGNNPFRNAFGHVFQAYVGRLLREALTGSNVLEEWKYGPQEVDTPDWIVVEGQRAVVIEVKHSALFLTTKQWGNVESLRSDLVKSIGKAVRQLARFQDAVSKGVDGLDRMKGLELQLVIVTFDRLHYANSVVRDELESVTKELKLSSVPHVHIVPVEAFEYLLGACAGASLFDFLAEKRRDPANDRMDFGDWLAHERGDRPKPANAFLSGKYTEFFEQLGIDDPLGGAGRDEG